MLPDPFHLLKRDQIRETAVFEGDVLFREGDRTKNMFVSKNAVVGLVRFGPDGEPIPIYKAMPGNSFAEASVFVPRYHCDAIVDRPGAVFRIPKILILTALGDPEFAICYNRIMSGQVQAYRQRIELLSIKSAQERVYAAIVAGYLDGSIMEFSEKIALTHEATYRALRCLVEQGRVVKPRRGTFHLAHVDPEE